MKKKWFLVTLICSLLIIACGKSTKTENPDATTAAPDAVLTKAPESTDDLTPTATPVPTNTPAPTNTPKPTATPTPLPKLEPLYVDFTDGNSNSATMQIANGWSNEGQFNTTWRKSNITFLDNRMQMILSLDTEPKIKGIPYAGAEYRTKKFYGYGRYEVSMKPIKNDGVVSSFFTYTGPSDGNPWDEIDIEFLGKDTTIVQFNYFTKGRGNHEFVYELGFDASEDFHTYAFEWHEDKIVWFVDGVEVYTATKTIPTTRGKIMMNVWCGKGVDSWLKAFDPSSIPLTAEYEWFSYTPFEE